jgi:type IV secretion system protein VirD4
MGKVGRRLVATEDRHSQDAGTQRRRARTRVGDRSAVVVVGPSRCGKTANVTAGVLDWDGPAILSSVKDDLYNSTVARRRQLGKVFVFDPFSELPISGQGSSESAGRRFTRVVRSRALSKQPARCSMQDPPKA